MRSSEPVSGLELASRTKSPEGCVGAASDDETARPEPSPPSVFPSSISPPFLEEAPLKLDLTFAAKVSNGLLSGAFPMRFWTLRMTSTIGKSRGSVNAGHPKKGRTIFTE